MKRICYVIGCSMLLMTAAHAQTSSYSSQGYPSFGGYMPPTPSRSYAGRGGVRFEKGKSNGAYTLRVYTGRLRPRDIEVTIDRGYLVLRSVRTERTDWHQQGGYSYSQSFSRFHRTLPLPRDAVSEHMSRTNGDGVIDIVIPKQQ